MHCHCGTNNRAPRWAFTDPCKPEVRPGARDFIKFTLELILDKVLSVMLSGQLAQVHSEIHR